MSKVVKGHVFYRNQHKDYPVVARGKGVFLYDEDGKQYLDGSSGSVVAAIGHGNEEIIAAVNDQMHRLEYAHNSIFTSEPQENLAAMIAQLAPGNLNRSFFCSGGSEAVEGAIKIARQYHVLRGKPSKYKIISRTPSYHGSTLGALSVTGKPQLRNVHAPMLSQAVSHIPAPTCYRCPFAKSYPSCGLACAHALEKKIQFEGPDTVAAFIAEPVIGSAAPGTGAPPEYYRIIREICSRHDVLFIADEVMCGMGRTGRWFAVEHWDVIPDIVTVAKGLGAGYAPLGATVTTEEVHQVFVETSGRVVHGHTYAGNPLSTAVGVAVLRYMIRENLVEKCARTGEYLIGRLRAVSSPIIGDVRGYGLMIGVEFVKDRGSKEPFDPALAVTERVLTAAFERGLLLYPANGGIDGRLGDAVLVAPPLTIEFNEVDLLVDLFGAAVAEVEKSVNI